MLLECAAAGRYTVQDYDITKLKPKTYQTNPHPHLAMWVCRDHGDLYRTLPWVLSESAAAADLELSECESE